MYIKVLFSCLLWCQLQIINANESCIHTNCHECITDPMICAWCSADGLNLDQRCKQASLISNDWCPRHKENPDSHIKVIDDHNFTSIEEDDVQIKPQKINLKLRVGEPKEFQFNYKAAKDYPVDMYFLLDTSGSMLDIRDQIANKSERIYSAMTKLTKDVYLGLGFFVDKNVLPFNNFPDISICYSFKHELNLTNDLGQFNTSLSEVKFGSNYDHPESGLDALAQVMACKDQIKWRTTSRKIIVYITDDLFHSAGDGMLAGINEPYDGKCYINDKGFYLKEKDMDYPSTGIISKLAADEQYTILFVFTKHEESYKSLSSAISGAHHVEYDQYKIEEKLSELYKQISNNLQLQVNIGAKDQKHFDITFDPDCTHKNSCAVVIGEEKHIKGTIRLRKYYEKDYIEIPIVQKGLKEDLTLVVDIISKCDCEHESRTVPNSLDCSSAGARQCGICNCNEGRTGTICLCEENKNSNSTGKASCIKDGIECSNNGNCICDGCVCQSGFEGPYCEYRKNDCKRDHTGALCSGHGQCRNGVCHCNPERTGEICECPTSDASCRGTNRDICNNRGRCECGRCKCDILPSWDIRGYDNELCDRKLPCDTCHDRQCRALTGCIACHSNHMSDCSAECEEGITVVNASTVTQDIRSSWNACSNYYHRAMSRCYSNFSYIYHDANRGILLFVLSEPDCIESYYIYGGMSIVMLVVIGLASLLGWKLMTEAQDLNEYKRFLMQAREENEEVLNECYTAPTSTYRNPMFKRSFR